MEPGETHRLGRRGEEVAAAHLEEKGWTVLARNVREGRREIDLVVSRGAVVAFVEVKARSGEGFGHPLESVTRQKRREISWVARGWIRDHPAPGVVFRFDAVAVHFRSGRSPCVEHVEDAWRLG